MSDIPKVCPTCRYFYFSAGQRGYSEMTPGSDTHISCDKNYWDIDEMDTDLTYRKKMLMAADCKDYELINLEEPTQ